MGTVQQAMGVDAFEIMRNSIRNKESGTPAGNYSIRQRTNLEENGKIVATNVDAGYVGAYQIGAQYAQEQGLIKPGIVTEFRRLGPDKISQAKTHVQLMENDNNWKTPPGSLKGFLASPAIQDKAFESGTQKNYNYLVNAGKITPGMTPAEIGQQLAGAHFVGAKGVVDGKLKDGAGNSVAAYASSVASDINNNAPFPGNTGKVNPAANKVPPGEKTATAPKVNNGSGRPLQNTGVANTVTIGKVTPTFPPIPLPFPNVLSSFASHNCVVTLSCISKASHSRPMTTYKAGNIGQVVLRSSGAGAAAGSSAILTPDNPSGQYDFGIDNIEINSLIAFNSETQGSNAYDISFDVYEPYSMGLFMQVCENAANAQGYNQGFLTNAIFLLIFEFIGYDSERTPTVIPNTTRHIPFTFKDVAMSYKAGGTVYKIKAMPSNELAFLNNSKLFNSDIGVSGNTVQEILQSGEFSLQTVINKYLQEYAASQITKTASDEVVIIFPKIEELIDGGLDPLDEYLVGLKSNSKSAQSDDAKRNAISKNSNNSATKNPRLITEPEATTVSRKTSAANLIQNNASLNLIGSSKLDFDATMAGEGAVNKQDVVQIDPTNPIARNKIKFDATTRQMVYSQGTSIINAISSILLHSKYCKDAVEARKIDAKGMVNWFRIESEVHFQEPLPGNVGNNETPKLLVFKIVPYLAHSERISANTASPKGLPNLKLEVAKEYDYLYTGKNTEVINFNIEFPQALFNAMAKDQGKQSALLVDGGQSSSSALSGGTVSPDNAPGTRETNSNGMATGGSNYVARPPGGTDALDPRLLVAHTFQRALLDSETDLVNVGFTIIGDPYFLADSGLGNFSNTGSGSFNVTKDLAMDYQSGEVDIIINFRTPVDYNSATGVMEFGDTNIVNHFSGLFRVTQVTNKFQKGKFLQELTLQRRRNQTGTTTNAEPSRTGPSDTPAAIDPTSNRVPSTIVPLNGSTSMTPLFLPAPTGVGINGSGQPI